MVLLHGDHILGFKNKVKSFGEQFGTKSKQQFGTGWRPTGIFGGQKDDLEKEEYQKVV